MLFKRALEKVPVMQKGKGFYSRYFLIHIKSGQWRPILDTRKVNKFLQKQTFRMVTILDILNLHSSGDFRTSRFGRRLLSYPHSSQASKIPKIHSSSQPFPIPGPSLWPKIRPMVIYQMPRAWSSSIPGDGQTRVGPALHRTSFEVLLSPHCEYSGLHRWG